MKATRFRLRLCLSALWLFLPPARAQEVERLSAAGIVNRMEARNRERSESFRSFDGKRTYHLAYTGWGGRREATLNVEAHFEAPSQKQLSIVSQSGSKFIINRVLKRLVESELEAADDRNSTQTALSKANYDFELLGEESVLGKPAFVLRAKPRIDNKFLMRGKIWVDAVDFAVAKIEAEPAKRPSFWISRTKIRHIYSKVGPFWLPAQNESTTDVRIGGKAVLTIQYTDYEVNQCCPY